MTSDDADGSEPSPVDLGTLLRSPIPFAGSSVPSDPEQARRYSLRLELRYKADQQRLIVARRHLSVANTLLLEMMVDPKPSRISLGMACGLVQAAREEMLS